MIPNMEQVCYNHSFIKQISNRHILYRRRVSEGIIATYNINWVYFKLILLFLMFLKNDLDFPKELGLGNMYFAEFHLAVCTYRAIPKIRHYYESL